MLNVQHRVSQQKSYYNCSGITAPYGRTPHNECHEWHQEPEDYRNKNHYRLQSMMCNRIAVMPHMSRFEENKRPISSMLKKVMSEPFHGLFIEHSSRDVEDEQEIELQMITTCP